MQVRHAYMPHEYQAFELLTPSLFTFGFFEVALLAWDLRLETDLRPGGHIADSGEDGESMLMEYDGV